MDISIRKLIIIRRIGGTSAWQAHCSQERNIAYQFIYFWIKIIFEKKEEKKPLSHLPLAGIPCKRTPAQHMSCMNMCWLQVTERVIQRKENKIIKNNASDTNIRQQYYRKIFVVIYLLLTISEKKNEIIFKKM